MLKVIFYLYKL